MRGWTELLAGELILTVAVLDRLLHNARVVNIKGRRYRLRDFDHALAAVEPGADQPILLIHGNNES